MLLSNGSIRGIRHKSYINGVWSLMTHFSLQACCMIGQKNDLLSLNGRFLVVQLSKRFFFFFSFSTTFSNVWNQSSTMF